MITAVLAELDQHTGILQVISAGHAGGIVIRDGKVVKVLPALTALPVPLGDKRAPIVVEEALEPGDRVLLYTDGIVEARSAEGQQFGLDRLIDFAVKADADGLPPPDTARRLVHAILDYRDDRLQDDATVLLAEWLSPAPPHSDTELLSPPADDLLTPGA
jgi:serine phosphatase RsbU (regulator of sigma subunit)